MARGHVNQVARVAVRITAPGRGAGEARWVCEGPLDAIGRYRPVLLLSREPPPDATGGLDADVEAALLAGGRVEMGDAILVR